MIRDTQRFGCEALLGDDQPLGRQLWHLRPRWRQVDHQALTRLAADLKPIRDRLRTDAQSRGWEVE